MFRFAFPSTRDMHIGDLRIALYNFMCATQANDGLVIRIEDGDRKNIIEGKDQEVLDMLALFGISYTNVYYQSTHFKYHLQFASTFLDRKKAFICFCTEKDIEAKKEKARTQGQLYHYDGTCENLESNTVLNNPHSFVIRMKKPDHTIAYEDQIKGHTTYAPQEIDSFVIMGTDKYPTYTFACACDDMLQGVSTIIRNEALMLSSPKEEFIRNSLGYDQAITYVHLPSILTLTGEEICTNEDAFSIQSLLDQGFMPESILNYLILLGNDTPVEIFNMQEAITWFDIKRISQSPVFFEHEKLCFINREHIKRLSNMELSKRIGFACENVGRMAKLYAEEVSTTFEIKQKIDTLFAKKKFYPKFEQESEALQSLILNAPYLETFATFENYLLEHSTLKGDAFYKPLRYWLTGAEDGPELALLYPLLKNYLKEIVR